LRKEVYLSLPREKKDRQGNTIGYIFTRDMLTFYTTQDVVIPYDQVKMIEVVSVKKKESYTLRRMLLVEDVY
jgi:hypothetical protein